MLGYTGMVSVAPCAYYGVGAYTVGLLSQRFHLPVLEGLVLAPLVAAAFGFVTGLVALRAVRLYFSLLTLAISQLLYSLAFNDSFGISGGENGVNRLAPPAAPASATATSYFARSVFGL